MMPDIRPAYEEHGVTGFYQQFGSSYRNPHETILQSLLKRVSLEWQLDLSSVLDLACGSGEATLVLQELGAKVSGIDPYTFDAFFERTGLHAEKFSFDDIANGVLEGRRYNLIVCSFALHLVEPSKLPMLMFQLAQTTDTLLILTPHKRPNLKPEWGWNLQAEILEDRVRARLYRTLGEPT
jgi:SAM-dependent methyltransferase